MVKRLRALGCLLLCVIIVFGMLPLGTMASNIKGITLYLDGYDIGKRFEDLVITTANEDIIIGEVAYLDAEGTPVYQGDIQAWKGYVLKVNVSHGSDKQTLEKMLYVDSVMLDDIPAHLTEMTDTGAALYFRLPSLMPSGSSEISLDLENYKAGKSVEDVKVVTKNKDIVIENVDIYADIFAPEDTEDVLSSSIYYCFAISFRAASEEVKQKVHDVVDFRKIDLETITPFAVSVVDDVYTVRFRMGRPGSPKSGAKKPYAAFELDISGYEAGNDAKNVTISTTQPGYSIGNVSFSVNRNEEDPNAKLLPGVYNHVTVEIITQEDFETLFLTEGIKLMDDRPCHVELTDNGCIAKFLLQPLKASLKLELSGYGPGNRVSSLKVSSKNSKITVTDTALLAPGSSELVIGSNVEEDVQYNLTVSTACEETYREQFYIQHLFGSCDALLDEYVPVNCIYANGSAKLIYKLKPLHKHVLVYMPEQLPTCDKEGKQAYYYCECGNFYEDENAKIGILFLSTWGNIEPLGHTESEWKSDETQHWKDCATDGCGALLEDTAAEHDDADGDNICDTCGFDMTKEEVPTEPDMGAGDETVEGEMPIWLSIVLAVLIVSAYIVAIIFCKRKKPAAGQ